MTNDNVNEIEIEEKPIEKKKKTTKREKIVFSISIILILVIAIWSGISLSVKSSDIKTLKSENAELQTSIDDQYGFNKGCQKILKDQTDASGDLMAGILMVDSSIKGASDGDISQALSAGAQYKKYLNKALDTLELIDKDARDKCSGN